MSTWSFMFQSQNRLLYHFVRIIDLLADQERRALLDQGLERLRDKEFQVHGPAIAVLDGELVLTQPGELNLVQLIVPVGPRSSCPDIESASVPGTPP